jgi:hypothetical protein
VFPAPCFEVVPVGPVSAQVLGGLGGEEEGAGMGFVGRQRIPGSDRGPADANHQFPALPTGFFCKSCHETHYQKARLIKSFSQASFL